MRTNVYYLATPPPVFERSPARLSAGLTLRLRVLAFWCRLRITSAEVARAVRRFGRTAVAADAMFLEQHADLIVAAQRRARHPARILDFAAARQRLRP